MTSEPMRRSASPSRFETALRIPSKTNRGTTSSFDTSQQQAPDEIEGAVHPHASRYRQSRRRVRPYPPNIQAVPPSQEAKSARGERGTSALRCLYAPPNVTAMGGMCRSCELRIVPDVVATGRTQYEGYSHLCHTHAPHGTHPNSTTRPKMLDTWRNEETKDEAPSRFGPFATAALCVGGLLGVATLFGATTGLVRTVEKEIPLSFEEKPAEEKLPEPELPKVEKIERPRIVATKRETPSKARVTNAAVDPMQNGNGIEVDPNAPEGNGPLAGTGAASDSAPKVEAPYAGPVQSNEDVDPPVVLRKTSPSVPEEARAQGIESTVVVRFVVTEVGDVVDAVVIEGNELFHGAVLEAIRSWKFKPASLFGRAVRFTKLVRIPFRLRE